MQQKECANASLIVLLNYMSDDSGSSVLAGLDARMVPLGEQGLL